jgi:hypothetical protein
VNARPDEQGLVRCRAIALDYGAISLDPEAAAALREVHRRGVILLLASKHAAVRAAVARPPAGRDRRSVPPGPPVLSTGREETSDALLRAGGRRRGMRGRRGAVRGRQHRLRCGRASRARHEGRACPPRADCSWAKNSPPGRCSSATSVTCPPSWSLRDRRPRCQRQDNHGPGSRKRVERKGPTVGIALMTACAPVVFAAVALTLSDWMLAVTSLAIGIGIDLSLSARVRQRLPDLPVGPPGSSRTWMTSPLTDAEIEAWARDPCLSVRTAARLAREVRGYQQGRLVPANAELAREWEISGSTGGGRRLSLPSAILRVASKRAGHRTGSYFGARQGRRSGAGLRTK